MLIKKHSKYILSLALSDPLRAKDGTSKYILAQASFANKTNMGFIHLCYLKKLIKGKVVAFRFGASIDGQYLGVYTAGQVVKLIKRNGFDISSIYLNNIICANFNALEHVLDAFPEAQIITMVHDFYLCCTNYTLFVNGNYCNAAKLGDKVCLECEHFKESTRLQGNIWCFLNIYMDRMEFNAPSESAKKIFLRFHEEIDKSKVHVIPNQNIIRKIDDSRYKRNERLRIGYIGYDNAFKGFDVFKTLADKYNGIYDFFWFNSKGLSIQSAKTIRSGYDKNHLNGMSDYVKENNVDALLLWAKCPETFSYVAVEALAAKAFMISYKCSGNVAAIIEAQKSGVVLDSLADLYALFDDGSALKQSIDEYKGSLEGISMLLEDNPNIVETVESKTLDVQYHPILPSNLIHPLNALMNKIMLRRYKEA